MRTLALLLVLLGTLRAAPRKFPVCVKDAKTALEIARTRGKLIFLTVMVDNDGENRMVIDAVFRNPSFIKISREFVCLLANPHDQHGKVAVKGRDGKRVQRCADCPTIRCIDHMMLAQNFARAFFPGSEAKTPIHFVIDRNEEVVLTIKNGDFEAGFNHVEGKAVVTELRKVLKKYGRGLSEIEYQGMLQDLADAQAARARRKVTLELQKLLAVVALDRKIEGVEKARARIKEIDAVAAKAMQVVDQRVAAEQWEQALEQLARIEKTYPGTLTAAAAGARRKEMLEQPVVKRLLKAADLYRRGRVYKGKGKLDLARKKFAQCVRAGKGTHYAELARRELDSLESGSG